VAYTGDGEKRWSPVAQASVGYQPAQNTLNAVKRSIGRRVEEDVVQKDVKLVPYKDHQADQR